MVQKVTDPSIMVTDAYVKGILTKQGIDWEKVILRRDYSVKNPSTKFYKDLVSGNLIAICQGLPKVRHDGKRICGNAHNETTVGWAKGLLPSVYRGKPNVFSVATVGTKVYFKRLDNQKRIEWSPQLFLDGVEKSCNTIPALLDDKDNPNYSGNVLEWDYKICKRRLRVIEGAILERWLFNKNPNGEIRIKHNQSGDLKLGLGEYRINDDEELVPAQVFDKAGYPLEIGASATLYSTASDGYILEEDATYLTCHGAADGDTIYNDLDKICAGNDLYNSLFSIWRGFLYFTHGLDAGNTVSAVTLSIYGKDSQNEADAGHMDIRIVEGIQDDPLNVNDYGDHESKTTAGSDTDYDYPLANDAYNDKALNATGIGWVQTAVTGGASVKFCLRALGDIGLGGDLGDGTEPGGRNYAYYWSNEEGVGFLPKLVITYGIGVTIDAPLVAVSSEALIPSMRLDRIFGAPVVAVSSAALVPSLSLGVTLSPPVAEVNSEALTPSIIAGTGVTIAVPTASVDSEAPTPIVTGEIVRKEKRLYPFAHTPAVRRLT